MVSKENVHKFEPTKTDAASCYCETILEQRSYLSVEEGRDKNDAEERRSPETFPKEGLDSYLSSTASLQTVETWRNDDDGYDDMSVASGYSYATYDTTATTDSVQDIISRLQSETDRRRRRLVRRRSSKRNGIASREKYSKTDPKLGISVEIRE
eukprot:CAMPEP_0197238998 /NCGR_PEP_ID=MMETSP1429-20130617/5495_1 /TAXON_ID=49237 /ORGANISM="Chaetoceros  sp., Strain UNC1202" /LENGTH=153 /DNA_ID=CAMNT_0042698301 /DNA_START=57 /DNA_END=518 /DNA_ORIENTATION=-